MADVDFTISKVTQGYVQDAIFHAVYLPLATEGTLHDLKAMIHDTVRRWRLRAAELSAVGLAGFEAGKSLQYIRNCPPVCCVTLNKGRRVLTCAKSRLCPFCWARHIVVPLADQIYRNWFWPGESRSDPAFDIYSASQLLKFDSVADALSCAKSQRKCTQFTSAVIEGGFTLLRIVPVEQHIRLAIQSLVAVKHGTLPRLTPGKIGDVAFNPLWQLSRKDMAKRIGQVCGFSQYLFEAAPEDAKHIVESLKQFRCFSTFGNLSGTNPSNYKKRPSNELTAPHA